MDFENRGQLRRLRSELMSIQIPSRKSAWDERLRCETQVDQLWYGLAVEVKAKDMPYARQEDIQQSVQSIRKG